jgi:hypothetical protein
MKIRNDLNGLYSSIVEQESAMLTRTIQWYDSYTVNPLLYYLPYQYIEELKKISKSVRAIEEKYRDVEKIMNLRGFKLMKGGGGTNRRVYECVYDNRILAKVALDNDGQNATLRDYMNQEIAKPFCTKIFEIDPSGTVSIIERVVPIMSKEEWCKYASDIYDILWYGFRERDIGIEDAGDSRIKNWGYRNGFGPVVLDFPSVYKIDPLKSRCHKVVNGHICGGTIDYDDGFNKLICTECGERYFAKDLALKDDKCYNSLGQAMNYRQHKLFEEEIKMKLIISDYETGEVLEVRESSNNKAKSIKQNNTVNNINYPPIENHEKKIPYKKFHYIIDEVDSGSPKKTIIEEPKPVIEKPSEETLISNDYNTIANAIQGKELDIDEMLRDFDKIIVDTALDYVIDNPASSKVISNNLIKLIKEKMCNGPSVIPQERLLDMFRAVSKATLIIPSYRNFVTLNESLLYDSSNNSLVVKMLLDRIFGETKENKFNSFVRLINTVKNTASFFEGIIAFYKYVTSTFSYDIDEEPETGTISYKISDWVFNIMNEKICHVIEDYLFNVKLNIGNLEYSMSNEFTFFREGLESIKDEYVKPGKYCYNIYVTAGGYSLSFEKNDDYVDNSEVVVDVIDVEENNEEKEEVSEEIQEETEEEGVSDTADSVYVSKPVVDDNPSLYNNEKLKREKRRINSKKKNKRRRK